MLQTKKNWKINPTSAKISIVLYGIAASMVLWYAIRLNITRQSEGELFFLYTAFAAAPLSLLIMSRKLFRSFISKCIVIDSNTLFIPRLFLSDLRIDIDQINMLEIFGGRKLKNTVIISRKSSSPVAVGEDLFMSQAHFSDFIYHLNNKIADQIQSKSNSDGLALISASKSANVISLVVGFVIATSFIIFSQQLENVDEIALKLAGLTKNSLDPNQLYRVFSSFFLHQNIPHLAFNLIALGIFARPIELTLNKTRAINIIFTSALVGSLCSLLISSYDVVIGASGGILGLMGSYTALHFKYKNELIGSAFISQNTLLATIAFQTICDLTFANIDFISHLFGFLTGAAYAIYVCRDKTLERAAEVYSAERIYSFILPSVYFLGLLHAVILYLEV